MNNFIHEKKCQHFIKGVTRISKIFFENVKNIFQLKN